jgi:hypothetical protein
MKNLCSNYRTVVIIGTFFSLQACKPKKVITSHDLTDGGEVVASIGGDRNFSIMIAKPSGLLSFEGPQGKISVGCQCDGNPNVLYQSTSGIYSLVLDEDGDGFPDTGVNRITGTRVKFITRTKE